MESEKLKLIQPNRSWKYKVYLFWAAFGLIILANIMFFFRDEIGIQINNNGIIFANIFLVLYTIWDMNNKRSRIPISFEFDDKTEELFLVYRICYLKKTNLIIDYKNVAFCYRNKFYKRRNPKTLEIYHQDSLVLTLRENNEDGWTQHNIEILLDKFRKIGKEKIFKNSI